MAQSGKWDGFYERHLASLVSRGVAALGDPLIGSAGPQSYRRERLPRHCADGLVVGVDMGTFVLPLLLQDYLLEGGSDLGPETLAAIIVRRAAEASRARRRHAALLGKSRSMLLAKIEREGAGMKLLDVRYTIQWVTDSLVGCNLKVEATIEMLNDALQPYGQLVEGWRARDVASAVGNHAPRQRKLQRARRGVAALGAALKVDAIAERAIQSAGRGLGEIAAMMIAGCDPDDGVGMPIKLSDDLLGNSVTLQLRGGRIQAYATIAGIGAVIGQDLILNRAIPETLLIALPNRPAAVLVDHPLFSKLKIHSAVKWSETQTRLTLKAGERPITNDELGEGHRLAA